MAKITALALADDGEFRTMERMLDVLPAAAIDVLKVKAVDCPFTDAVTRPAAIFSARASNAPNGGRTDCS